MAQRKNADAVRAKKKSFHHGDLREALIAATRELLIEHGPDGFTLADACRRAGVTTAAPYKHFRDKQEILEEIVARSYVELRESNMRAIAEKGRGTIEGITAMGISYLEYALAQPAIFGLMFGELKKTSKVDALGNQCLKSVVEEVAYYSRKHGHDADAEQIAIRLWTFVHGASSLELDDNYEHVAPGLDVRALIADVTPRLLGVAPEKRVSATGKIR
jgi:AcrR family transcriptional regulator